MERESGTEWQMTGFTVQSVFGEPGGRERAEAEFSGDFVLPIMKQVAEIDWMKTPGTIILDRFCFRTS